MAYFGKEFNLVKQEKFEDLVNTLDVPQDAKAMIIASKSPSKIAKNADGSYTLTSITVAGPKNTVFQNGVEYDDNVLNVFKGKSVITVDGDTFTQVIKSGDKQLVIKRQFSDNELVVTITASDFSGEAKRYYKA